MVAKQKPISFVSALSGPNGKDEQTTEPSHVESTESSSRKIPQKQQQQQKQKQKYTPESISQRNPSSPSSRKPTTSEGPYKASTYRRRVDHIPRTSLGSEKAYIISLKTDQAHHKAVTTLRNQYFPPTLNKLSAHIALFHALPGSKLETIRHDIDTLSQNQAIFPIKTSSPFRLKRGVSIAVSSGASEAKAIFEHLRSKWERFLSKQDRGAFKTHYTIMNKVDDEELVEKCLEEVKDKFEGSEGVVEGLDLRMCAKGYWKFEKTWRFREE